MGFHASPGHAGGGFSLGKTVTWCENPSSAWLLLRKPICDNWLVFCFISVEIYFKQRFYYCRNNLFVKSSLTCRLTGRSHCEIKLLFYRRHCSWRGVTSTTRHQMWQSVRLILLWTVWRCGVYQNECVVVRGACVVEDDYLPINLYPVEKFDVVACSVGRGERKNSLLVAVT